MMAQALAAAIFWQRVAYGVTAVALAVLALIFFFFAIWDLPPALSWRNRLNSRRATRRVREVSSQLTRRGEDLTRIFKRSAKLPQDRAEEVLIKWKTRTLEYLDANIGWEAVSAFHGLATTIHLGPRTGASFGGHLKSSYDAHLGFLTKLASAVERGVSRPRDSPMYSGKMIPVVKSFVYDVNN